MNMSFFGEFFAKETGIFWTIIFLIFLFSVKSTNSFFVSWSYFTNFGHKEEFIISKKKKNMCPLPKGHRLRPKFFVTSPHYPYLLISKYRTKKKNWIIPTTNKSKKLVSYRILMTKSCHTFPLVVSMWISALRQKNSRILNIRILIQEKCKKLHISVCTCNFLPSECSKSNKNF